MYTQKRLSKYFRVKLLTEKAEVKLKALNYCNGI